MAWHCALQLSNLENEVCHLGGGEERAGGGGGVVLDEGVGLQRGRGGHGQVQQALAALGRGAPLQDGRHQLPREGGRAVQALANKVRWAREGGGSPRKSTSTIFSPALMMTDYGILVLA